MSYFYADGVDRSGNRLITSYGKADQAKRYRPGAQVSQGEKYLTLYEDGTAKLTTIPNNLLCRTLMVRSNPDAEEMSGRFVVWAKVNGRWQETDFRYPTYAKANAAVKSALINLYAACAVIETEDAPVDNESAPATADAVEDAVF